MGENRRACAVVRVRGAYSGREFGADGAKGSGEEEHGIRIRRSDHRDELVGQKGRQVGIERDDGGVIPLVDSAQHDVGQ